jgi:hypothetical protein
MDVRIHRGSKEIGGTCIEIASAGKRILIDAGLPLKGFGDGASPPLPQLDFDSLLAVVISHPHLDHYGLLPWLPTMPIVMGAAARQILLAASPFMRQAPPMLAGQDLVDRYPIAIGPFTITPYLPGRSLGLRCLRAVDRGGRKTPVLQRRLSAAWPQVCVDGTLPVAATGRNRCVVDGGHGLGSITPGDAIAGRKRKMNWRPSFAPCASFRETSASSLALIQASAQNIDRMVNQQFEVGHAVCASFFLPPPKRRTRPCGKGTDSATASASSSPKPTVVTRDTPVSGMQKNRPDAADRSLHGRHSGGDRKPQATPIPLAACRPLRAIAPTDSNQAQRMVQAVGSSRTASPVSEA